MSIFMGVMLVLFWPEQGLVPHWRKTRAMTGRVLSEDALKHIHHCETEGRNPTVQSIAGALQVTTDRAVEILGRLQERELVCVKHSEFCLTPDGREYALRVIRAHRLWERYLADKTGFDEPSWHSQADVREHRLSPEEIDALAAQLGNPTHDPHGDPIPTASGEVRPPHGHPLSDLEPGTRAVITHIEDEPEAIYAQLVAEGLHAGMEIRLTEVTPQRIKFWCNGDEHLLAPLLARNVTVIPQLVSELPGGVALSTLQPGESARVVRISQGVRGLERRRLLDLGILPETVIQAEMRSPSGDPTAYRIRGALIALRAEQAEMIKVEK